MSTADKFERFEMKAREIADCSLEDTAIDPSIRRLVLRIARALDEASAAVEFPDFVKLFEACDQRLGDPEQWADCYVWLKSQMIVLKK